MQERMRMEKVAPGGYRKVLELHTYAHATVEPVLLELIKLRTSMVNGCAFCVDMHGTEAAEAGETPRRLFALSAWTESPFFSEKERAALALTDAVTCIGEAGVPDEIWDAARAVWSEKEVADIVLAAIMMNAFNRIAISTRRLPEDA